MKTFVVGCNHRTAPLPIREKLAFDGQRAGRAIRTFRSTFNAAEMIILSTCNRTEMYVYRPDDSGPQLHDAIDFLAGQHGIATQVFRESLYHYEEIDAVRHLFRVASSLDSMVVGESGIVAQVKQAMRLAREVENGGVGQPRLDSLFQKALAVARRIRRVTRLSQGRVSIGSTAVEFARQILSRIDDKTVLMIGAGKMGELTVKHLQSTRPRRILVTNRTPDKARELAGRLGAEYRPFDPLAELLAEADIVLSCTGSDQPIITRQMVAGMPARRSHRPLVMIDMAVPRDIEEGVSQTDRVYAYDIDDLQRVTERHAAGRRGEIAESEWIIESAVLEYQRDESRKVIGPAISQLHQRLQGITHRELEWLLPKLKDLSEADRRLIEQMLHRVVGKVLHEPSRALQTQSHTGAGDVYALMLQKLFNLSE